MFTSNFSVSYGIVSQNCLKPRCGWDPNPSGNKRSGRQRTSAKKYKTKRDEMSSHTAQTQTLAASGGGKTATSLVANSITKGSGFNIRFFDYILTFLPGNCFRLPSLLPSRRWERNEAPNVFLLVWFINGRIPLSPNDN